MNKKVAIIGGGASGLVASIFAARAGFCVEIFEKNTKVGRKILATGNGRCNLTNRQISINSYYSKDHSFIDNILKVFGTKEVKTFFSSLGLEMTQGAKGRLYPMSLQSSSVVDLLLYQTQKLKTKIHLNCEIKDIRHVDGVFTLLFDTMEKKFNSVIIATGSASMPTLGSSDSGYKFAKKLGHKIHKPFASLVQLISNDSLVKSANGVKIDANLEVFVQSQFKKSIRGDLLFTNYGLSGSAILDVSRVISCALSQNLEVKIKIDLLPSFSHSQLKSLFLKRLELAKTLPLSYWLNGILHKKLIDLIIAKLKLRHDEQINRKSINKLIYVIKNLVVKITDTKGIKNCEVVAGGIETWDINSNTMESKLVKDLFFCGEVLDVDGDCGGYNLHFAWASGYVAGTSL